MSRTTLVSSLAVCLLLAGLACDSASPVAPAGTLLSISASPGEISANGTSTIRVTALRANGTPVNPGTIVRLDTTLGTLAEDQIEIDDDGTASTVLRGDGRIGSATVTARSGSAETATVEVMIGEVASNVSLQATPSSIAETGGNVTLLAVVRNEEGQPLPGVSVNFTTALGRLASGGAFLATNSQGQVTDRLTVTESDVDALPSSTNDFDVGVNAGGGATATFNVKLESPILEADFEWDVVESDASTFTVQFIDFSRGDPSSYLWSFGDGVTSRDPSPEHEYAKGKSYNVVLKVTRGRSESTAEDQVTGPS